ncbi:hypothetical protein BGX38DRAFT_1056223, partial [Terfezia claveryi]
LSLSLLIVPSLAVIQDEAYKTDWHVPTIGLSIQPSTFFHRPQPDSKASLIYTLTDRKVLAAINPRDGALMWRQSIAKDALGFNADSIKARPADGKVLSAAGSTLRAWDANDGRLLWTTEFNEVLKDVRVSKEQDAVVLCTDGSVQKVDGTNGNVIDDYHGIIDKNDVPVSLHIYQDAAYVVSLSPKDGTNRLQTTDIHRRDTKILSASEVRNLQSIIHVGSPGIAVWREDHGRTLMLLSLKSQSMSTIPIPEGIIRIDAHTVPGYNTFLLSFDTLHSSWAEIWKMDGEDEILTKIYDIPAKSYSPTSWSASAASNGEIYFTWSLPLGTSEIYCGSAVGPLYTFSGNATEIRSTFVSVSEVIPRTDNTYALRTFVTSYPDTNTHLTLNGVVTWTRPELLSGMKAVIWVELLDPTTEEVESELHVEESQNVIAAYIHRIKRHIHELITYGPSWAANLPTRILTEFTGAKTEQILDGKFRDAFGFRKLLVGVTSNGGMAGIDFGQRGKVLWFIPHLVDMRVQDIKGFYEIAKGVVGVLSSQGRYVEVDVFEGKLLMKEDSRDVEMVMATSLIEGKGEKKVILAVVRNTKNLLLLPPELELVTSINTPIRSTPPASIGKVMGDRSVMYKYLNPHMILLTTQRIDGSDAVSVYLLDSVSGAVLYSASHTSVDKSKKIVALLCENWFVYSFYANEDLTSDVPTTKGYQLVVTELYESPLKNDRGPLRSMEDFSSFDPQVMGVKPYAISQTYVSPIPIIAMSATATKQSITTIDLLVFTDSPPSLLSIPKRLLDPRRPVGRDPDANEREEGLLRYDPVLPVDHRSILTHKRELMYIEGGNVGISTSPSLMESTSLVVVWSETDVFGTRVTPSGPFDMLGKGFGKAQLVATVVALTVGVWFIAPMVRKKQINQRW